MRPWLAWSTFVLAATAARPAAADTVLGEGSVLIKLFIPEDNGEGGKAQSMNEVDFTEVTTADSPAKLQYLNQARCICDKSAEDDADLARQNFMLRLSFAPEPDASVADSTPLEAYAGDSCDAMDPATNGRDSRCASLRKFTVGALRSRTLDLFVPVGDLLAPGEPSGMPRDCTTSVESEADIYVLSGADDALPFDEADPAFKVTFDLTPPTMPTDLTPIGLENAIRIRWTAPASERPDVYQALCVREDGTPAHTVPDGALPEPTHDNEFYSTQSVCGLTPAEPTKGTLADGSAEAGSLPDALKRIDPAYVCGQSSGDSSSIDLAALDDDVPYWVVVLAIDTSGNYSAVYVPRPVTPKPVTDFWEDLNEEEPGVDGGFCVSQVGHGGSAGSGLLVLAAVALVTSRRRRRAASTAALTTLALVALAPGAARAQSFEPYWIDSEADSTDREDLPQWHLGLRVGPYHPRVDEGFASDPGPFRRMFGPGYNLVPQLDLHRLWSLTGVQLGVGLSAGYYRKTAEVFEANTDPSDPDRPRVSGAINTFQMVPLSVSGLARLTVLDDRWGIPVVPYARGGVAYNVWWVRTPTGELAVTDCATCDDTALGASAGLVGAVGLAIRGERLDSEAEHSMKNSGVEHAGFYVELETAWVDGFGNERRLSLGDTTWYAGVDFEF